MEHHTPRDHATTNVLAWTAPHSANVEPSVEEDASADTDEPPENRAPMSPILSTAFHRTPIRRASEHHESLLTKALQNHSDEETFILEPLHHHRRRQSVTSNTSSASTADLTCGTGITTPARTSSPSPRLTNVGFVPLVPPATVDAQRNKDAAVHALAKKRCISFACAARPKPDVNASMVPTPRSNRDETKVEAPSKKTTIKFACPSQPPRATEAQQSEGRPRTPVPRGAPGTPKSSPTLQKARSSSTIRAVRSPTSRKTPGSPVVGRNRKWLTAASSDLQSECARFHEFASDEPQEDDWIRRDYSFMQPKLTIDDTLKKENAIRKLGKEAEEEAELEDQIDEEDDEEVDDADLIDDNDNDNEDEDGDGEDDDGGDFDEDEDDENDEGLDDDAETELAWESEASEGYKTDNEIGFAESESEDDDLVLWDTRIGHYKSLSGAVMMRRMSEAEKSDSSISTTRKPSRSGRKKRSKTRPVTFRSETPELPDSTDFVCGTFDEDKPLEEAYISCVEARKRGRHPPIPQDIDPSFPTSEPEDEDGGESDEHLWLHGELEDLHHERDRKGRKKKGANPSPKRCRSPPPKRRASPAPKLRGRSPRKVLDQWSPRMRSPAPLRMASKSPIISPAHEGGVIGFKTLAFGPGLTQTKSLPRAPGLFPHLRARKPRGGNHAGETHVRGAIDIVKGLEKKRQRRKEKFYQKYYNRARKEKAQTRRPPPGQGAERMRELGLFMAGKTGHGNYVLSI